MKTQFSLHKINWPIIEYEIFILWLISAYFDSLWNNFSNKICYLPSPMVLVLNLKALIARVVRVLDESGTRQHEEPHRA